MTGLAIAASLNTGGGERERLAAERLQSLGVLVTKGPDRKSVTSAALVTLKDGNDLTEAVGLLKDLSKLTSLDLRGTALTDAHMVDVARAKSVLSLTLTQTSLSDTGVAHLAGMRKLQSLYLNETKVSGASIMPLSKLSQLRILDLSATKVAGGLGPLAELPQLDWLLLRNLSINDDSLATLGKSQSLKRLSLGGSEISNKKSLDVLRAERSEIAVEK